MDPCKKTTSPLAIAAAWILVTTPLGWGVYQSIVKSLPLFGIKAAPARALAAPGDEKALRKAPATVR